MRKKKSKSVYSASLTKKALRSALYKTEDGKKVKTYMVPHKRKKTISRGTITGNIPKYMREEDIGYIDVQGVDNYLGPVQLKGYMPPSTRQIPGPFSYGDNGKKNSKLTRGVKKGRLISNSKNSGILPKGILMSRLKQRLEYKAKKEAFGILREIRPNVPISLPNPWSVKRNTSIHTKEQIITLLKNQGVNAKYSGKTKTFHVSGENLTKAAWGEVYAIFPKRIPQFQFVVE